MGQFFWQKPGIISVAPTYLGFPASRPQVLTTLNTSNFYANSASFHYARTNFSQSQIYLPGWYSNNGENAATGNIVYQASIEQPLNTIIANYTFSSASSGTALAGGSLLSDLISHPRVSGTFYIRVFQDAHLASGIMTGQINSSYSAGGDRIEVSSTSIASKTTGGAIATSGSFAPVFPFAIIAPIPVTVPSLALIGDSITVGIADTSDASGDIGILARSIGPNFGYASLGSSGETAFFASNVPFGTSPNEYNNRKLLAPYVTHVLSAYGFNDINTGQTVANIKAAMTACWSLFGSNKRAFQTTITPGCASSDSFMTLGGQSALNANFSPLGASTLNTINTWANGSPAGVIQTFDVSNVIEPVANDGLWPVNGTAFWAVGSDGIHPMQVMNLLVQSSNVIPASAFHF